MKAKIYTLDEILTFGKHRGMSLREVVCHPEKKDPMYVQWLIAKVHGFALNRRAARFCYEQGVIDSEDVKMNAFKRKELEPRVEKGESMRSLLERVMSEMTHGRQYIPTGFKDLDRIIGGLQAGNLYLLGGGVSVGKTSLALTLARHLASQQGKHVAYFTLNETNWQMASRMMTYMLGHVDTPRDGLCGLSPDEQELICKKSHELIRLPIVFNDKQSWTLDELAISCQMMHHAKQADVIIIDPIQAVAAKGTTFNDRMTHVVQRLKRVAKDCHVPVICLSSLNRAEESDRRNPSIHEMRGSGALEDCADVVLMMCPTEIPLESDEPMDQELIRLNVAKNRGGRTGSLLLCFAKSKSNFGDSPLITD